MESRNDHFEERRAKGMIQEKSNQRLSSRPLLCYVNVKKENRPAFVFVYVSVFSGASLFLQRRESSIAPERSPQRTERRGCG